MLSSSNSQIYSATRFYPNISSITTFRRSSGNWICMISINRSEKEQMTKYLGTLSSWKGRDTFFHKSRGRAILAIHWKWSTSLTRAKRTMMRNLIADAKNLAGSSLQPNHQGILHCLSRRIVMEHSNPRIGPAKCQISISSHQVIYCRRIWRGKGWLCKRIWTILGPKHSIIIVYLIFHKISLTILSNMLIKLSWKLYRITSQIKLQLAICKSTIPSSNK